VAACLALAACGSGGDADEAQLVPTPAETEPEPDAEVALPAGELAGVWRVEGGNRLLWLGAGGRFAIDDRGLLDRRPAVVGTYELDGATIRLANGEGDLCPPGDWALEGELAGEGVLQTVVAEDVEGRCSVGAGTRWRWVRVSPPSPAGAALAAEGLPEDGVAPGAEALSGIWLLEGSGLLLRFADGTYALDDEGELPGAPADAGTVAVGAGGEITLTSGAATRRCSEGDGWVWSDVRLLAAPSRTDAAGVAQAGDWALVAAVAADDCGHRIPDGARWLRLSP
jgi:hypothetical protein